jgi:hypothetical protein
VSTTSAFTSTLINETVTASQYTVPSAPWLVSPHTTGESMRPMLQALVDGHLYGTLPLVIAVQDRVQVMCAVTQTHQSAQ